MRRKLKLPRPAARETSRIWDERREVSYVGVPDGSCLVQVPCDYEIVDVYFDEGSRNIVIAYEYIKGGYTYVTLSVRVVFPHDKPPVGYACIGGVSIKHPPYVTSYDAQGKPSHYYPPSVRKLVYVKENRE